MMSPAQALIIEADAHNLVAADALLREQNITYKRNTTGTDVVRQARALLPHLRLILLSLDLPESDPCTIYQDIKADAALRDIPIVAIVAEGTSPQTNGFDALLPRPLPRRAFSDLMAHLLNS